MGAKCEKRAQKSPARNPPPPAQKDGHDSYLKKAWTSKRRYYNTTFFNILPNCLPNTKNHSRNLEISLIKNQQTLARNIKITFHWKYFNKRRKKKKLLSISYRSGLRTISRWNKRTLESGREHGTKSCEIHFSKKFHGNASENKTLYQKKKKQ